MLALLYQMKNAKKTYDCGVNYNKLKGSPKYNYVSKCRVCLNEGTISIFNNENSAVIMEALQIFGDISITEDNDGYPKKLCKICFKFLKSAILFRKVAKQSQDALKRTVKEESNVETLESYHHDYDDTVDSKDTDRWPNVDFTDSIHSTKTKQKTKVKYSPKVTCHICNKVLNRSYYKQHIKAIHDPDHEKYICDVCGKSFRYNCAYRNHTLRHRNEFAYKCQFCPYRGRHSQLLKIHMRTHTGDYRYRCTECPARFLFNSNWNRHMLKHKEPQFKCDACKRAFYTKLMLQRHYEADHLGIKNHVCNICGKAFGYRNGMIKHQRKVHKREKMSHGRVPSYLEAELRNRYE